MKPEDLKRPFKWDARCPLLKDGVFYVPERFSDYVSFSFPDWQDATLFGNNHPVKIEYCSGNGAWIADCSLKDPSCNWVAIEKRFDRVRKIWSKRKNLKLNNLLAVSGLGYTVTKHYFKDSSVDEIFINFPDPWPKTRHAKHRIVQPLFIQEMWRILKKNGKVTIVTDDEDYSQIIIEEMRGFDGFSSQFSAPYYKTDLPGYGTSYFEELWRSKGKLIRYHQFLKKGP
ncbi:tRNA (guanine-N(7)-)-methyltransferase [Chlamydiales bacterium STE3]|nr:tRNA (guanine-N(7)-)-methyltransferase [Chlamydiales bacterium STE3]